MIDQGLTEPSPTNYTREDVQNLFKQGRVGMMITAPFLINQIAKEAPKLQYGIAPVPKGTTTSTYAVTDSIIMFKNSKVKKSAWKFLDYLFTKEPRVDVQQERGLPADHQGGRDRPVFRRRQAVAGVRQAAAERAFRPDHHRVGGHGEGGLGCGAVGLSGQGGAGGGAEAGGSAGRPGARPVSVVTCMHGPAGASGRGRRQGA